MIPVKIHLMLNHAPLWGTCFAFLLLVYSLAARKEDIRKVALAFSLLVALVTPAVFFSGEKSEDLVERIPGVVESAIESHEEAGELALTASLVLAAMAATQLLLYLFPSTHRLRGRLAWAFLLVMLAALLAIANTARLGGKIRHTDELGGLPNWPDKLARSGIFSA